MSVVQLAVMDTGSNRTLAERLIDQLADRIGGLGVELADIAGNVQEVAHRVANQSERFHHLQETAETMVSANHDIANASQAVQTTTSAAVGEIAQSRSAVDTAVSHISESRRGSRADRGAPVRRRLGAGAGRKSVRLDRGDRKANEPAGAQRHHRSRARGQCRPRLRGGRKRSEESRRSHPPGHASDLRHRARSRRPDRRPDRREQRRLPARQDRGRRRASDLEHHLARAAGLCVRGGGDRQRHARGDLQSRTLRHRDQRASTSSPRASICPRAISRMPTSGWRSCSTRPRA